MSRPPPVPIDAAIKDAEETNGMREAEFEVWLDVRRGLNTRTVGSRISNCRRVEAFEGNLDDQYDTDGLAGLIERLTYSREDARHRRNPKHKVPIDGDIYNGTAALKSAVGLYRDFRSDGGGTANSTVASAKRRPQVRRVRRPGAHWPVWPQPSAEDLLDLARAMAPFVRFLAPDIVGAVAEDNRLMGPEWSSRLRALGIDPDIYLWEGSPCAFPGIRRYAGSEEQAVLRKRAAPRAAPPQCLDLDDNDYPKHLWAFVFTGKPFRKQGPEGYQLAHLFDHKEHENRWRNELELPPQAEEPAPLYGLFTSAANSVYAPGAFLRPTDFSSNLRSLIQRRALQLYDDICRIVPPPLKVKDWGDPNWATDKFPWSAPVGGMDHIPAFLDFRCQRMTELIGKRHADRRADGNG